MKKLKRPVILSLVVVFSLFCHVSLYKMVYKEQVKKPLVERTMEIKESQQGKMLPDARLVKYILELVRQF